MRLILISVALCAGLTACQPKTAQEAAQAASAEAAASAWALECAPPFGPDADKASLKAHFGAANVVDESVPGPEGSQFAATVIFPRDPTKRLEVIWQDEAAQKRIGDAATYREGADWTLIGGVKIGSSLEDVRKANGKPFVISGFGWDYGGYVVDWGGGAFGENDAGCHVSVRFEMGAGAPEKAALAASGDGVQLSSDAAETKALGAYVTRIAIGYPAQQAP